MEKTNQFYKLLDKLENRICTIYREKIAPKTCGTNFCVFDGLL